MRFPSGDVLRPHTCRTIVSCALVSLTALVALKPALSSDPGDGTNGTNPPAAVIRLADYGSEVHERRRDIVGRLYKISDNIKETKDNTDGISDEDLNWILAIINAPDANIDITSEALKPLEWLRDKKVSASQRQKIADVLFRLISADDVKADPKGYVKSVALDVMRKVTPEKRFLSPAYDLTREDRRFSQISARMAYRSLRERYYGDDGGFGGPKPPAPANAEEARLQSITQTTSRTHAASDADVSFLIDQASHKGSAPEQSHKFLVPLTLISAKSLTPPQRTQIKHYLETVLTQNDTSSDPEGLVKMMCCNIVWFTMPDKVFVPLLEPLLTDSRHLVKGPAEEALAAIRQNVNNG